MEMVVNIRRNSLKKNGTIVCLFKYKKESGVIFHLLFLSLSLLRVNKGSPEISATKETQENAYVILLRNKPGTFDDRMFVCLFVCIQGPQGPRGFAGYPGPPGQKGNPGQTGKRGLEGSKGKRGRPGLIGEAGRNGPRVCI